MDRDKAKQLADLLKPQLEAFAKAHGLTLEFRGGQFDAAGYTPKFELKELNADGIEFNRDCHLFGLRPEHYGLVIPTKIGNVKITGFNVQSRKFPLLGEINGQKKMFGQTVLADVQAQLKDVRA